MSNSEASAKLYIVATPIGNLEDITLRALKVLKEADVIACEDTRRTLQLLNSFEIKKHLISYHEHSDEKKLQLILDMLSGGKSVALVSDAGMPCISDPGYELIHRAAAEGYEIIPVPGACAAIAAVAVSGFNASQFTFIGFLPKKNKMIDSLLQELRESERTLVFYEAPHRLLDTLKRMGEVFGDRGCSVSRELTKIHELTLRTTLWGAHQYFTEHDILGEFVIVVEGARHVHEIMNDDQILEELQYKMNLGMTKSAAVKSVTLEYDLNRNRVYQVSLRME